MQPSEDNPPGRVGHGSDEIRDDLRRRITEGEWRPGDKLPRLQDLLDEYQIRSRAVMDRALQGLKAEGLIRLVQGSGIYVRHWQPVRRDLVGDLRMEYADAIAREITDGLHERVTGVEDVDVPATYDWVGAPEQVAAILGIHVGAPVLRRTFKFFHEDVPHQIALSYMSADLAEDAGLRDASQERPGIGTMFQLYAIGIEVDQVEIDLAIRMPTPQERADLEMEPGTPVFANWRTMFSLGRPVEVTTGVVRGDQIRYHLTVDMKGGEA